MSLVVGGGGGVVECGSGGEPAPAPPVPYALPFTVPAWIPVPNVATPTFMQCTLPATSVQVSETVLEWAGGSAACDDGAGTTGELFLAPADALFDPVHPDQLRFELGVCSFSATRSSGSSRAS